MSQYSILYHHQGILVVNKNFGLPSQPSKDGSDNLFDLLRKDFPQLALHHRLDQVASGLVLCTSNPRWNKSIATAFRTHRIQRNYYAWVLGTPESKGSWTQKLDSKQAHTDFTLLQTKDDISLLEIQLQTGRTHQIRRHAQLAGYPLIGDRKYGSLAGRLWPRLALHAYRLCFEHPATREEISISCPIPPDLQGIFP